MGADWDLEALANGPSIRAFRKDFLDGNLTWECHGCPIKVEISLADFAAKLTQHLEEKTALAAVPEAAGEGTPG
jgi:hypothetical protein